jgi:hypothetical protein
VSRHTAAPAHIHHHSAPACGSSGLWTPCQSHGRTLLGWLWHHHCGRCCRLQQNNCMGCLSSSRHTHASACVAELPEPDCLHDWLSWPCALQCSPTGAEASARLMVAGAASAGFGAASWAGRARLHGCSGSPSALLHGLASNAVPAGACLDSASDCDCSAALLVRLLASADGWTSEFAGAADAGAGLGLLLELPAVACLLSGG